jgi:hypothetical protein
MPEQRARAERPMAQPPVQQIAQTTADPPKKIAQLYDFTGKFLIYAIVRRGRITDQ